MNQESADLFAELASIADQIHPRDLIDAILDLYRYDTDIGPISYQEFHMLAGDGDTPADRLNRIIIREEAEAFGAYLHTVRRCRQLSTLLINEATQRLDDETGPTGV